MIAALAAVAVAAGSLLLAGSSYRGAHAAAANSDTGPPAWLPHRRNLVGAGRWIMAGEAASVSLPRHRPRVLFVGDSLTEWWLLYGIASWKADFAPLGAYDDGVAGDTTSNVLYRLDSGSLTGIDPRVVVVEVGTNNIGLLDQPATEVAAGITAVVETLHSRLPGARILLEDVYPRDNAHTPRRVEVDAINAMLARTRFQAPVTLANPGQALLDPGGAFRPGVIHNDLLHPTASGYRILASHLDPVIRRLLQ